MRRGIEDWLSKAKKKQSIGEGCEREERGSLQINVECDARDLAELYRFAG